MTEMVKLPAAFRRLCVETRRNPASLPRILPAAFRRLCVETAATPALLSAKAISRLQAAVC